MANNKMLIDAAHPEETRVVMVRGNRVDEFDFESEHKTQLRGNIYLAKVTRVEPSLQAAFVDYGGNRHGFLAFSEIHPDYYQIPVADRQALLDAEAEDARAAAAAEAEDEDDGEAEAAEASEEPAEKPTRKRRSRRRGKKTEAKDASDAQDSEASDEDTAEPAKAEADEVADTQDADDSAPKKGKAKDTPDAMEVAESEEDDSDDDTIAADNENDDVVSEPAAAQSDEAEAPAKKPRKRAVRRKKPAAETVAEASEEPAVVESKEDAATEPAAEAAAPKAPRKTSRPKRSKKVEAEEAPAEAETTTEAPVSEEAAAAAATTAETDEGAASEKPKRRRRRTSRKSESDGDVDATAATTDASQEAVDGDAAQTEEVAAKEEAQRKTRSRSRRRRKSNDDDQSANNGDTENGVAVEDLGSEDAMEEVPARRAPRRHYKIQEVIKRRQILLVQVVKEERGNKGAALTTYLSLAGRYSVLMPNTARGGGISRKITNTSDRKRLKTVASALEVPQGMGVILRTAGASRQPEDIQRDFEYLMRLWENVRTLTLESTAPFLVYEEGSLIKRSIRDLYDKDTGEILVAGEAGYREAKDFMTMLMPNHAKNVKLYRDRIPMFARMGVESQLDAMLQPQVTLKSGGYIIIDQTEALVAIDVNSGRSTRQHSIEETATQTNLEAADEVARQLRLRDLAGLIVIDFIDMEDKRNIRNVEKRLKDALKNDRARIQVGRISHFGLMEMSRQRIRASVLESTTQACPVCEGLGHVRAASSVVLSVLRTIEENLNRNSRYNLAVKVSTPTALYMLNNKRDNIGDLETRFGVTLSIMADDSLGNVPCAIERGEQSRSQPVAETAVQPDSIDLDADADTSNADATDADADAAAGTSSQSVEAAGSDEDGQQGEPRKRRRRRRRRKGGSEESGEATEADASDALSAAGDTGDADQAEASPEVVAEVAAEAVADTDGGEEEKPKPAKRARRSRAKKSDTAEPAPEAEAPAESTEQVASEEPVAEKPKRTRRKKAKPEPEADAEEAAPVDAAEEPEEADSRPKRRTTRRKKVEDPAPEAVMAETAETETVSEVAAPAETGEDEPKKGGWWQRKFF